MTLATSWLAAAMLFLGLGSELAAEDRAPGADGAEPRRLARSLPGSPQDHPVGDTPPDAPALPSLDAGPLRPLGALALVGILASRRGPVNRRESSSSRGPPIEARPPAVSFPLVPSRIHKTPLAPPPRWSTGRGPPALGPRPRRVSRSAPLTSRAQETDS